MIVEHVARSFAPEPPAPEAAPPPPEAAPGAPAAEGSGVVTTAEELQAWEDIVAWVRAKHPDAQLAYRDAKGYFTIHQNNVRKWCIRLGFNKAPYWVSLRHVLPAEAKALIPGVEAVEGGQLGDTRIGLATAADLARLRPALVLAFEREALRVAGDTE